MKNIYLINSIISIIMFAIGKILIDTNTGRLGVTGFVGYSICTFSIIAIIYTIVAFFVVRGIKKDEE